MAPLRPPPLEEAVMVEFEGIEEFEGIDCLDGIILVRHPHHNVAY